jgi:CheY-like chemotaxis protein
MGAGQNNLILIPKKRQRPATPVFPFKKARELPIFDFLRPNDWRKIRERRGGVNAFQNIFSLFSGGANWRFRIRFSAWSGGVFVPSGQAGKPGLMACRRGASVGRRAFTAMGANSFAIRRCLGQAGDMTEPLALLLYEKLLPGSQLVNRLQDLNYRVQAISDAGVLVECAEQAKPMLVLADLASTRNNVCDALARLKQNPATRHLPVIAFSAEDATELQAAAKAAGVTLIVSDAAVVNHLPQFLEQALQVE